MWVYQVTLNKKLYSQENTTINLQIQSSTSENHLIYLRTYHDLFLERFSSLDRLHFCKLFWINTSVSIIRRKTVET